MFEGVAEGADDHGVVESVARQLIGLVGHPTDETESPRMRNVETGLVGRFARVDHRQLEDHFLLFAQFENTHSVLACISVTAVSNKQITKRLTEAPITQRHQLI